MFSATRLRFMGRPHSRRWKHSAAASTEIILEKHKHLVLLPTREGIAEAASLLRQGRLVSFPTETVYGLGADALNESAVMSIFAVKERPLTNPLIVHILDQKEARELVQISTEEQLVFDTLARTFWPGPLTLIVRASHKVPSAVTANTGNVGIRVPSHPLARALLAEAKLPIAAPSANRSGHVSPTRCSHVLTDLGDKGVHVLHGEHFAHAAGCSIDGINANTGGSILPSCHFGIESTVVGIDGSKSEITIHRQGAIAESQIRRAIQIMQRSQSGPESEGSRESFCSWHVRVNLASGRSTANGTQPTDLRGAADNRLLQHGDLRIHGKIGSYGDASPGLSVSHYAPSAPCYILMSPSGSCSESRRSYTNEDSQLPPIRLESGELGRIVMLDFGARFLSLRDEMLAYRDLSPRGSYTDAATCLFDSLRWAEMQDGVKIILLPQLAGINHFNPRVTEGNFQGNEENKRGVDVGAKDAEDDTFISAGLQDRMHRATSGGLSAVLGHCEL